LRFPGLFLLQVQFAAYFLEFVLQDSME
jgi:hypothetical protein